MHCPMCENPHSKIIESDSHKYYNYRRRWCSVCGDEYTTVEVPTTTMNRLRELFAAKRDIESQIDYIAKRKLYARTPEESPA